MLFVYAFPAMSFGIQERKGICCRMQGVPSRGTCRGTRIPFSVDYRHLHFVRGAEALSAVRSLARQTASSGSKAS
jgi:hypothetical protein